MIVERADVLQHNPGAQLPKHAESGGPLVDLATADGGLVEALRTFSHLQELRHLADYDHDALFEPLNLASALRDATKARELLADASAASREAFFTLLTVRRADFRER